MDVVKEDARAGGSGAGREEVQCGERSAHAGNDVATGPRATPSFADAEALAAAGYELIPLKKGSKLPRDSGWTKKAYDAHEILEEARRIGGNLGVRLRPTDLVIDVDPRNGGDGSLAKLVRDAGLELDRYPHVITGGGGHHYYLHKPADVCIVSSLPQRYPGIDFKHAGGQVVAPGAVHPGTGLLYESEFFLVTPGETPAAPDALLQLLRVNRLELPPEGTVGDRWGEISPEQLAGALESIPPEDFGEGTHDSWFPLMCACHHATAGEGREEFIAWSILAPGCGDMAEDVGYRWDSLSAGTGRGGRPYTIATLYETLKKYGASSPHPPAEEDFEPVDASESTASDTPLKRLGDEFVWVADASVFIRRKDLKRFTPDQWRSLYEQYVEKSILNKVWKSGSFVRKFESLTYWPRGPEMPEGPNGRTYNIWRASGVTPAAGDVGWFLAHMAYLVPNDAEREAVLDYLAHLVQRPEEKIHFALVIHGGQGTGKSAIGELMLRIIGDSNVSKPSNDELLDKWTSWQEGAQLAILEELMTLGRLEVANRLKPLITEPVLRIQEKYQTTYSITNRLNLLCFTNHRDALKIERGDRRWFIVYSPAKPKEHAYYATLFRHITGDGPAHVAHWLAARDLSKFDAKGHAPATAAKEAMRELSMSEVELDLYALWEDGLEPFDFPLVSARDLEAALDERVKRKTRNVSNAIHRFLQDEIGAIQHTRNTSTRGSVANLSKSRLWSVRDHDRWASVGPTERAKAYAEHRNRKRSEAEADFAEDRSSD